MYCFPGFPGALPGPLGSVPRRFEKVPGSGRKLEKVKRVKEKLEKVREGWRTLEKVRLEEVEEGRRRVEEGRRPSSRGTGGATSASAGACCRPIPSRLKPYWSGPTQLRFFV